MLFEIKFKNDIDFGIQSEDKNIEILNNFFKCNLVKTNLFDEFDFIDEDKKVWLIEPQTNKIIEMPKDMQIQLMVM